MTGKILIVGLLSAAIAMGQSSEATKSATSTKPLAFDVISIRQNISSTNRGTMPVLGPTADGYRMERMPLILPIMTAYVPSTGGTAFTPDQITGLPDWATRDTFDLQAKVGEEDLPEWKKPGVQNAMLQEMLRSLLEDRCKIKVHREVKEVAVYSLVAGKSGPKFKPTDPQERHEGTKLPFGGTMIQASDGITLYAASMESLATLLSSIGSRGVSRPILNKTGLAGEYDIVISTRNMAPAPSASQDATSASDPGADILSSVVASLGLKLESTKAPVETLVVDHIERPSEN